MPAVDLSSLNRHEMRRLLAAAEARRNHALAERLRVELDGRATATALPVQPMRPVTERVDRAWEAEGGEVREDARASGRIGATILAVAAASVVAMVAGWQLGRREQPAEPARPAVAAVEVPTRPAPQPARLTVEVAPAPPVAAKPAARPEAARAERRAEPRLSPQDRRMRRAYDRARAAGVDRLTLDRGQARFRTALARAHDPGRADALYARRIRELEAAARRGR